MGMCLSQDLIERYINGSCSQEELQAAEAHLAQCVSCRKLIESTRADWNNPDRIKTKNTQKGTSNTDFEQTQTFQEPTRAFQDDLPTKSIPQITSLPYGKDDFTKSLGSMIEGYEIIEELPRGGQAAVYKAVHTATKTNVAIKVLLPTMLASARARYLFEREAELVASLDHPNIVGIRDSGIIHHQYYFVMQYIEGQPLDRYILSEGLSFRQRVLLFDKICAAVTYAHQQGIIHRDLKFANILVDKRGEPHVLDFGLAKAIGLSEQDSEGAVVTMTGQLAGTLSTMSPEQAAGRPDLIDVRTDVYSLGVILYRMLTREYPYDVTGSTLEVLQNIQEVDPVRPRTMIRKFDSDIEAIVLTALEKEPDKRYQSATDLRSDIGNWINGRPIRVRSISTLYLVRKIIARHKFTSAVAALLLLIILGFAYVCFYLLIRTRKAQQETKATANQLSMQVARNEGLNRLFAFTYFLEAWRKNRNTQIVMRFMSQNSKEYKAAVFLSDSRPVAEKENDFRQVFSNEQNWFAEFIIGENLLKNGKRREAHEAFKRSRIAAQQLDTEKIGSDGLLIGQMATRLNEFDAAEMIEDESNKLDIEN
jgi:serine/threonine protein kinase